MLFGRGRGLQRRQLQNWIVLDLRRLDPSLPGMLLEERRLFGRTPDDPSGLWRAVLTSQIVNCDPAGMTVTTDDLTRYELIGHPGRLDAAMQRSLDLHLSDFHLVQWKQVGLMSVASWSD